MLDVKEKEQQYNRKLLQRLRDTEKELEAIRRHNESAAAIRSEIFALANYDPTPPKWLTAKIDPALPGVPMTVWSDWHLGETVLPEQVAGQNAYNLKIAEQRIERLVKTTIALCKDHMVRPEYPGIVVCLGGDFITGAIHDELAVTNDGTVQQACHRAIDLLIGALDQMAGAFGKVFVPCVVGNHGRDTTRPRFKNAVFQNYEWSVYQALERHYKDRGDKRFIFKIAPETDYSFAVLGHRFHLTHGDNLGVKGGDGIIGVIGPIARGTTKLARSEAQIGRDFDTAIICHYHTYIGRSDAIPAIVNGSLIGYNEYARLALRVPYSRPCQALWFIHRKHGFTASWPVYCDDYRQAKDNTKWVSWRENK
jgi:hypothetical protein